jgi:hypothetical protein
MPGALDKLRRSWKERFRLSSRLGREQHRESSVPESPQPSAPHSPEAGPPALPTVTAQPMAPATELSSPLRGGWEAGQLEAPGPSRSPTKPGPRAATARESRPAVQHRGAADDEEGPHTGPTSQSFSHSPAVQHVVNFNFNLALTSDGTASAPSSKPDSRGLSPPDAAVQEVSTSPRMPDFVPRPVPPEGLIFSSTLLPAPMWRSVWSLGVDYHVSRQARGFSPASAACDTRAHL